MNFSFEFNLIGVLLQIKLFIGLGPVGTVGHIHGAMSYLIYLEPEIKVSKLTNSMLSATLLLQGMWDVLSHRYELDMLGTYGTSPWHWADIKVRG